MSGVATSWAAAYRVARERAATAGVRFVVRRSRFADVWLYYPTKEAPRG